MSLMNYIKKNKINHLLLHETKYWKLSLRPNQITIGSCLISLNRECKSIKDLSSEELKEFKVISKIAEGTLSRAFGFEAVNYLLLMMDDKQIHYHVIPRYSKKIHFLGKEWIDKGWPKLPEFYTSVENESYNKDIKTYLLKAKDYFMKEDYCIGYTTGVFDLFHVGHLNILKKAKEKCDYLIVGVTTDELVSYKNKQAIISLEDRMKIVESIEYVDEVVIQSNMDKMEAWQKFRFNKMFVGSDWQGTEKWNKFEEEFKQVDVEIIYIPYTSKVSSTILREKISTK